MMTVLKFIASVLTSLLILICIIGICNGKLDKNETKAMTFVMFTQIINIIIILGG